MLYLQAIKSVGAGSAEWRETYTLKEFSPKSALKELSSKSSSSTNSGTVLEVIAYNHNTLRPDGTIGSGQVDRARLSQSQLSGSGDRVTVPLTDKKVHPSCSVQLPTVVTRVHSHHFTCTIINSFHSVSRRVTF
jgi:hypothetical protein